MQKGPACTVRRPCRALRNPIDVSVAETPDAGTLAPVCIRPTDAASVSLLREGPRFETSNATSAEVIDIDGVQYATHEGPGVTAAESGEAGNADEAFRRLRSMSQKANRKLRDVAGQVVESVGP